MPPKSNRNAGTEEEPTLSDLFKLLTTLNNKVSSIEEEVKKVQSIEQEVRSIKTLVTALTDENKELKAAIKQKDEQLDHMQIAVNSLETKLNSLEQHHRGWSAGTKYPCIR